MRQLNTLGEINRHDDAIFYHTKDTIAATQLNGFIAINGESRAKGR